MRLNMTKESPLMGKKILIVDDEPDVLSSLEDLLDICDLVRATSFEQAKHTLETEAFDLVILDIMGVDGYSLLDITNEKEIPAVMLTAHALSPENTVKSYKRGAAFFVPKEKMSDIESFLSDILEAKERGEHYWSSWLDRLEDYYDRKFGPNWKDSDQEFWDALAKQEWRLAAVLRGKD
jgi:DNA-binding NtrC family response regulator